jgi:hypothetical protein
LADDNQVIIFEIRGEVGKRGSKAGVIGGIRINKTGGTEIAVKVGINVKGREITDFHAIDMSRRR